MVNLTHAGFGRALPDQLQVQCAERLLNCLNMGNLLVDGGVIWGNGTVDVRARLTAVQTSESRYFTRLFIR